MNEKGFVFNEKLMNDFEGIISCEINRYSDKSLKNNRYAFGNCLKEDLRQEALLVLYNATIKYPNSDYEGFKKYAIIAIRNVIIEYYHKHKKDKMVSDINFTNNDENNNVRDDVYSDIKAMYYNEVQMNYREMLDILNENKSYLNKRCKFGLDFMLLHYLYGYKFTDISKMYNMTPKQVYDRVERFPKIVKDLMCM